VASLSSSGPAGANAKGPIYATLARRIVVAIALTILLIIPTLVMFAVTRQSAATWAAGAGIAGAAAVVAGGVEVGVLTSFVIGLLTPVSIVAGGTPVSGAAIMAVMCLVVGRLSRFGLNRATLLVPIFMAWMIINPPTWGPQHTVDRSDGSYLAWMGVIFVVGSLFAVFAFAFIVRKLKLPAPKPHSRSESVPYTATITVLATVSTYIVLHDPAKHDAGAWLIATILVLSQVGDVGTVRRTIGRVLGTLVGSLLVIVIVVQVHSVAALYVIGLLFAIAAIAAKFSPHYWIYMALITPTVVCMNASSSAQVANLGKQRAADTLLGAALVLLAAAATIGYSRWQHHRDHGTQVDDPVILGQPLVPGTT
jgi:hypothetical protein